MALSAAFSSKAPTQRRLKFFLITCLIGAVTNSLAITLPFVVPFMLGNVAFFVLLVRLGPLWSLAALILVGLPVNTPLFWLVSILQFSCIILFKQQLKAFSLPLLVVFTLGCSLILWLLQQQGIWFNLTDLLCALGLLLLNYILIIRASEFILSLSVNTADMKQQNLREQISKRIAIYSAIPSAIFIALILNSAIALHFSNNTKNKLAMQTERQVQLSNLITSYTELLHLSSLSLNKLSTMDVLELLVKTKPEFLSALTTDQDGIITGFYIDNPELKIDISQRIDVSDRYYYQQAKSSLTTAISDSFLGRPFGEHLLFAVSHPIIHENELIGIIQLSVGLDRLDKLFANGYVTSSQAFLQDRNNKIIWEQQSPYPLGSLFTAIQWLPLHKSSWLSRLGLMMPDTLFIDTQDNHLVLVKHDSLTGWTFTDKSDLAALSYPYYIYLLFALLLTYFILEFITKISAVFGKQYTASLEKLAEYASSWDATENHPQVVPELGTTSSEFESLRTSLTHLHFRVIESQRLLKQALQQRILLNEELEQRVISRTEELAAERDNAKQLAMIKTRFLANMSHEIRTPLTIISGFIEQINLAAELPYSLKPTLQLIAQNTRHLQHVINDILDTAKLEEGKVAIKLEPLDIRSFLAQQIDSFTPLAIQKQLALSYTIAESCPAGIQADAFRLAQILNNLLSNAIKFTQKGSIEINVYLANDQLVLDVTDTGVGIRPEQQLTLFSAFNQADSSTSRQFGGTGLGLYISKTLAELQHIQLTYLPHHPQGSCFRLIVPAEQLIAVMPSQLDAAPTPATIDWYFKGKILLVDDVAEIRKLLRQQLNHTGAIIIEAANGYEALNLAAEQQPELIILDQQMPGIDGFETARQLRANGFKGQLVSLSADVYEVEQQQHELFALILAKPIKQTDLISALQKLYPTATPSTLLIEDNNDTLSTDDAELLELQSDYLQAQADIGSKLQQAIYDSQFEHVERLTHQLKGTSACLELMELASLAATLNTLAKACLTEPKAEHTQKMLETSKSIENLIKENSLLIK